MSREYVVYDMYNQRAITLTISSAGQPFDQGQCYWTSLRCGNSTYRRLKVRLINLDKKKFILFTIFFLLDSILTHLILNLFSFVLLDSQCDSNWKIEHMCLGKFLKVKFKYLWPKIYLCATSTVDRIDGTRRNDRGTIPSIFGAATIRELHALCNASGIFGHLAPELVYEADPATRKLPSLLNNNRLLYGRYNRDGLWLFVHIWIEYLKISIRLRIH